MKATDRQMEGLIFCGQFFAANDQLPTFQIIADHFGWSSPNAAQYLLLTLERKGYLERNAMGRFKFTAKGRVNITKHLTAARWHPTDGSVHPMSGMYVRTATV